MKLPHQSVVTNTQCCGTEGVAKRRDVIVRSLHALATLDWTDAASECYPMDQERTLKDLTAGVSIKVHVVPVNVGCLGPASTTVSKAAVSHAVCGMFPLSSLP